MRKHDLAQYLVNLHTLLNAQSSNVANPSATLGAEYERVWAQLKEEISNETGSSNVERAGGPEAGADLARGQHQQRERDRDSAGSLGRRDL